MQKNEWKYILINGSSKVLKVLNPEFEKGTLNKIDDLEPFDKVDDKGEKVKPNVEQANFYKRKVYKEFLKKPFKNLLVLSGAGSSMDVDGKSMLQLWDKVETRYKIEDRDGLKEIKEYVNFDSDKKDLEALLSQIDGYTKFVKDCKIKIGEKEYCLSDIKADIFNIIRTNCTIPKPKGNFPHKIFLEKLLQRKQTNPRVKIFTLNYDLLFEYAATEINAIVIDGFSFVSPRTFSGRFFDYDIVQREGSKLKEEDNFIQRVFLLHKLHGSLNWEKHESDIIVNDETANPLIIYPREAKYEDSYEQPYFEMMARFQRSLRLNNDTMLICIGYSFNDKHINRAIEEALNQNPGFRMAVVTPQFDDKNVSKTLENIKATALDSERVLIVSETFSDFAKHFPEIQTYSNSDQKLIKLIDDKQE